MNFASLIEKYGNEDKCREYLEILRWPDGVTCPRCGAKSISRYRSKRVFDCNSCRYQFSATAGTIFHDSHLPLWKWFLATYLMVKSEQGISANQLKHLLSVTYKTAWYLCHRIRIAMSDGIPTSLKDIAGIHKTRIGEKAGALGYRYKGNNTIVAGTTESGVEAMLKVIDNTRHSIISHRDEEEARGNMSTKSAEDIWSLLKGSITNSYHKLSIKHLDAYMCELEWRSGNRDNPYLFRDTLLKLIKSDNITYQELTFGN